MNTEVVARINDTHPSGLDIYAILSALQARQRRLRGLWVQWYDDGTGRCRTKGEVVVSVQFDHGMVQAAEGRGVTVRDACRDLITVLGATP
jgi:hypothetical protein